MSRTLTDVWARLGYELADTGHTEWETAELTVYVNQAVREVMRHVAKVWPDYWLSTTESYTATSNIVSGTANYDLPSDFYKILLVVATDSDGDDSTLDPMSLDRAQNADAEGYYLMNDDIYIVPEPDASVTSGLVLYYISIPTEVTAGASAVPLSDHFEDAIVEYAVLKAKARQGEPTGEFASFFGKIQTELDSMMADVNKWGTTDGLTHQHRNYS